MDRRLKLTAKQKELVKDLEKAFEALAKEHVGIIFDDELFHLRLFNDAETHFYDISDHYSEYEEEYLTSLTVTRQRIQKRVVYGIRLRGKIWNASTCCQWV